MSWKEKFNLVISCLDGNEDIEQDFYIKAHGVSNIFIDNLKVNYPFITNDYLEFLEITDGADIAQCVFFGVDDFDSSARLYVDVFSKEDWMPFAYEAGGDPLLLHKNGKIFLGDGKSNKESFIFLANSFSDFLCDVLMGQRYASIFRIEEIEHHKFYKEELEDDENPWLTFLVNNKWISGKDIQ